MCCYAEQVIMQVWISTHFGVISKRPPNANEELSFIGPTITPLYHFCKGNSGAFAACQLLPHVRPSRETITRRNRLSVSFLNFIRTWFIFKQPRAARAGRAVRALL